MACSTRPIVGVLAWIRARHRHLVSPPFQPRRRRALTRAACRIAHMEAKDEKLRSSTRSSRRDFRPLRIVWKLSRTTSTQGARSAPRFARRLIAGHPCASQGFSDDFEEQIEEQKRAQQEELEQLSKQFVSRDTFMQSKAAPSPRKQSERTNGERAAAPPPQQQQQYEAEAEEEEEEEPEEDVREGAHEPVQEEPEEQPGATQHAPAQERAAESEPSCRTDTQVGAQTHREQTRARAAHKPEPDDSQEESEPDDSPRS